MRQRLGRKGPSWLMGAALTGFSEGFWLGAYLRIKDLFCGRAEESSPARSH
jgi:hypothetical protein